MLKSIKIYTLASICLMLVCVSQATYAASKPTQMPAVPVQVTTAKAITWQPSVQATGTLVAEQGITVRAETAGRITNIYFKSGEHINKGQPLVQIYPDILKAQLQAAEATLKLDKLNYQRYQKLYKQKAISASDYDTAMEKFKSSTADVDQIKAELNQTLIKAPFSGYLGIRQVSVGDYITAGTAIVNLQDTDPMFVDFSIPESEITSVKVGNTVSVYAKAFGNKPFTGKVVAMDSLMSASTRSMTVRASIPNPNNTLIPGAFVQVKIYIGQPQQVVIIPQTAVSYSLQGDYVYKVVNNKVQKVIVKLGKADYQNVIVLSGLKAGDEVVTAGTQKVSDGSSVTIVK